uniref:hypothetical protein n=1 Tax=Salmonella sp. s51228 TaxID=3159652 RepID=UPI00398017CE
IYKKTLSLDEATSHSLFILKQVMEEKLNNLNVEVVQILLDGTCKRLTTEELDGYITNLAK